MSIAIPDAVANSLPVNDDARVASTNHFRRSRLSRVARPMSRSPTGTGATNRVVTVPANAITPKYNGNEPHISLMIPAVHETCARFGVMRPWSTGHSMSKATALSPSNRAESIPIRHASPSAHRSPQRNSPVVLRGTSEESGAGASDATDTYCPVQIVTASVPTGRSVLADCPPGHLGATLGCLSLRPWRDGASVTSTFTVSGPP